MLTQIFIPVSIVSGLGLLFGLGLSFASKKFEVQSDEKIGLVREVLPGANCAACGYTVLVGVGYPVYIVGCRQCGRRRRHYVVGHLW